MKKLDVAIRLFGAVLILFTAFPGTASADPTIADVENLGDTLVFHPLTEFASLVLTVTGPCDFQYRQVVTKGEPVFRLDQTTIDGRYTYDLVREEAIDPAIIKVLQEARQNFDEETPRALCRAGKLPGPPDSQSEGFGVVRGEIIYDPGSIEKAAGDTDMDVDELATIASEVGMSKQPRTGPGLTTKDFVINDDLIVDGSACIGFDCVNGESFGFDTLRLKENNLRIKFDDTSTAASFPRNDWQLTANDSANGGASKFSIDDISNARTPFTVEANARSHSLYVDDGGRIGSRTSTPSVEIHTIDGDTPTLRLQQDGSSGFAPQTWDVAGNETNFFVRDVTNGSALPFRIRPGAPSSAIFIDVDGDVGLGTSSPDADLHIFNSGNVLTRVVVENGLASWDFRNTGSGQFAISKEGTGVNEVTVDGSGNLTVTGNLFSQTCTSPGSPCAPDYVFESEYSLMPLDELAGFLAREKHLPNVPSAEDLAGPVNISELQMRMLEKIEELTLYTLQQEDTIKELRSRLESLESDKSPQE